MMVAFIQRILMPLRATVAIGEHKGDSAAPAAAIAAPIARHQSDKSRVTMDLENISLEELADITRHRLTDRNLEVSKVRPFFWVMVEAYVDRFQLFPFDAVKSLFNYLEFHGYPEHQLRELITRLEELYQQQHGTPVQESARAPDRSAMLEEDILELRQTLKYAAIAGERIESYEKS